MRSLLLLVSLSFLLFAGCAQQKVRLPQPVKPQAPKKITPTVTYSDVREHSYRTRKPIPNHKSRYEGSLWQDESSWGNLLRDHRARFKGDVLTITNLADIISIQPVEPKIAAKPAAATPGEALAGQANVALDAIAGLTRQEKIQEETNDVLGSLKTITARVQAVLPNGNMVIIGEKIDYRQQNAVRYITKIKGVIRPEDVTENNEINALKLARSEIRTKRQVQNLRPNYKSLAPVIGRQKAGLLDRLSHIATPPASGAQPVGTK